MKLFGLDIRLASALAPVSDNRGGWWPIVREPFSGAWQRNQEWTRDTVLAHHAVYACITRIAQDFGKLRPKLVERDGDGIWSETTSPAFSPVLKRPNRFQNFIQFKEWWATSKLSTGNAYALKERDAARRISALYLLDPQRVTVLVAPDGEVFYELKADNLAGWPEGRPAVPASEIVHDRMNCLYHPLVGTSPIFACGQAANMGLHIERNSSAFFGNGSNPSGLLSTVQDISKQKALELREVWAAQNTGNNSGFIAVLGSGMKFEQMRMSAVDSQLIEQLKWSAETVCSTFGVPAWKIGVTPMPPYTKPEVANLAYYSDCLQTHIESFELCMDAAFGFESTTDGKQYGIELDLEGLERMDRATQVDTLTKGIRGGLFTPNGARKKIDEKPLEGGDTIYLQHQDYPMEKVFNREDLNPAPPPAPAPTEPEPDEPDNEPDEEQETERRARLARHVARRARTLRVRMIAA